MASFPELFSGTIAKYPVVRQNESVVRIARAVDDTEQRWKVRKRLERFMLQFDNLQVADRDTIKVFFDARKGRHDDAWDLKFENVVYEKCSLDQDDLTWTEERPEIYGLTLRVRQTV